MKTRLWISLFLAAGAVLVAVWFGTGGFRRARSSSPAAPRRLNPELVDGRRAFEQSRRLIELGPRHAATPGAERAARHIAERLQEIGVHPKIEEFRDVTPAGEAVFRNVLGVIPGDGDRIIVLASHYDTKSGISRAFAGANDSGSSAGLLLELAGVLRKSEPLPCNFILAFFDGEECMAAYSPTDGLHGSRYLAQRMKVDGRAADVQAVILLDMISDRDLTVTIPRNSSPVLVSVVFDAAREEGVREKFSLAQTGITDDHVPFRQAGMPAIDIIDFEYGSAPRKNDYWHTVQDTMDKLSPKSMEIVGRVVIRAVNKLAESPVRLRNQPSATPPSL